jgi:hypothetical protein
MHMFHLLKFGLPFAVWLVLSRSFICGDIPLNMDTNTIYGVAKYYFNNLLNGVVPLWEPFITLGRPFYAISICNLFNPVTQLVPLLKLLGLNYNLAFIIYMVVYFFAGCLGFYFLAREILKDKSLAYVGYVAFMFSSLGFAMFTQFTFLEILVPSLWFFYFLIAYARKQTIGNSLGATFSLMAVLSSYLPFYFLTVLAVFVVLAIALFPKEAGQFSRNRLSFMLSHKRLTILCVAGLICAALPLLTYKMIDASGDSVSPGRHCQYSSVKECYDRTLNEKGSMLYDEIARSGGLGERLDVGYLFAHLDKITYGSDSLFFIPVWIFVLLVLSLFLKTDRINVLLVGMMLVIGLIALGDSASLHKFLYDHVFFFGYFRNLFFLCAFLIPLVILFALRQLKALLSIIPTGISGKKMMIVWVLLAHAGFALFLKQYDGVMAISFVTVGLSALLLTIYYLGIFKVNFSVWSTVFSTLLIIQPAAVMNAYAKNAVEFKCILPSAHVKPVFGWVRPDVPATSTCRIYQFVPYEDFWYAMSMTDAPAKVGYPQAASRWTFELSQVQGEDYIASYAKYKVYVYDAVNSPGVPVTGPSKELDISHFDVNRVVFTTNYDRPKILVYNDAFTKAWHAKLDGKKVELLRANGAFKGIEVPAGEHAIEFVYAPPGGQWAYIITTVSLLIFLGLTIIHVI